MLEPKQFDKIAHALPLLRSADPELEREFRLLTSFIRIPTGKDVFVEGDQTEAIAVLVSGVVRVYKISSSGREITLYRFGLGQSCILTANAILSRQSFPAIATVEQEVEAVMVPAEVFREWVNRFDVWRNFVFELLSQRLVSVLEIVNEVAFKRMDKRLAAWLVEFSRGQRATVPLTHQEIASELGSAREVISRLLEDFAFQGWILVGRGKVEVLEPEMLRLFAEFD